MSRLTSIKRLTFAALAAAGVVAACRAAQPGEAPPLAPRPEIGEPTSTGPVPGVPDPLDPPTPGPPGPTSTDAGPAPTSRSPVSQLDPPVYEPYETPLTPMHSRDAGASDGGASDGAGRRDAQRSDAAPPPDATPPVDAPPPTDAAPPARDARVPDARDGGVGLPPNPDASLPWDGGRPMH